MQQPSSRRNGNDESNQNQNEPEKYGVASGSKKGSTGQTVKEATDARSRKSSSQ
jgi:hypothetical protein